MPFLVLYRGNEEESVISIEKDLIQIGRYPEQDISIYDDPVSRMHAQIVYDSGQYHVKDLGSRNGTKLNGVQIEPKRLYPLKDGDKIEIGWHHLKYIQERNASETALSILTELRTVTLEQNIREMGNFSLLSPANQRLSLLFQLGEAIESISDIQSLLFRFMEVVFRTLKPENGFMGIYDSEFDRWKYEISRANDPKKRQEKEIFQPMTAIIKGVMAEGKAVIVEDKMIERSGDDPEKKKQHTLASDDKVHGRIAMCCPILDRGRSMGVIYVDDQKRPKGFQEEDLKYLSFLGTFAGKIVSLAFGQDLLIRRSLAFEPQSSSLIFGTTPKMKEIHNKIPMIATANIPLLLLGETGTGKSSLAFEIHRGSLRKDAPFVVVNCAAIPENLLESELYGYAPKSGLANADPKGKPGKFELADGGTLFLDEIGDMPLSQQAKILDVLENKVIYRIGATSPVKVNVRMIAATAKALQEEVERRRFREELYHRLSRITLTLPSLRERIEDIPELSLQILKKLSLDIPKSLRGISKNAMESFCAYAWPGNIRELENAIAHAMIECPAGEEILSDHLPSHIRSKIIRGGKIDIQLVKEADEFNKREREKRNALIEIIRATGSLTKAAQNMGISKQWMIQLAKKYGIQVSRRRSHP